MCSACENLGKRVLLVHWNPDCAFCELLAPDLAQFQADLRTSNVQLVLASPEDAKSNRELALEHGLTCPQRRRSRPDRASGCRR